MPQIDNPTENQQDQEIIRKANRLFAKKTDWVTFFRQVLGVGGIVRTTYPSRKEMAAFERTETYTTIQQMLTKLRETRQPPPENGEPISIVTVRLPKSVHELLIEEAHEHRTSMNKLCISKLLQFIDDQLVPDERARAARGAGKSKGAEGGKKSEAGADV